MKIFITGGNGFLGKKVIKKLVSEGHQIRVLVIPEEDTTYLASFGDHVEVLRGDLTQPHTIKGMCEGVHTVVHLAALLNNSSKHLNMLINYEATKHIADAAESAGVKQFVFTSSTTAVGETGTYYGESKKKAEEYLATKPFTKIILRPALLYGKGGFAFENIVRMVTMLPVIVPMIGPGTALKQPIHVDDAASIVAQAAVKHVSENKVYSLGGPKPYSFKEMVKEILHAKKEKRIFVHAPRFLVWIAAGIIEKIMPNFPVTQEKILEMETSVEMETSILEKDFDLKLTTLQDGLAKSV